ncbi:MAG TPA: cytochrome c oxidase assembly protein [Candidatus Acidoferrales bacterium]|nr:cytochrome c oxidase assembly protein [Candidatus Acidoferrales bacterium]
MPSAAQAALASWSFPPVVTALNLLTALLYLRGWIELRHVMPGRFTPWRLACFLGGIATLEIALASPIDTFDPFLLTDHMIQHMFLMVIVPPLVLLGDPLIPLLRGMPRWAARNVVGPFLSRSPIARLGALLVDPPVALLLLSVAMVGWHLPVGYDLALRSPGWHEVEHACFLVTSLLFWWPVIQPWPSRPHWPAWGIPVYLLLGDFVNSVISAFLAFSERVIYPWYLAVPRLGGLSAQNDQVAAGAVMWVIGSFAFLIPAAVITVKLLSPQPPPVGHRRRPAPPSSRLRRSMLPALMVALPLAAIAYAWVAPDAVDLDGDVVRLAGASGPFQVSVFGDPGALSAGPADLAVLVQDRNSGSVILDADDDLAVQSGPAPPVIVHATRAQSTNKLLEAATVHVPSAGLWNLRVSIREGSSQGALAASQDAAPPVAESGFSWGYAVGLAAGAGLIVLYLVLRTKPLRRGASLPHAP